MTEIERLEQALSALESQSGFLGQDAANTAMALIREKLATLKAREHGALWQRKHVTILFADISGFTAMSEKLDPEDVTDVIDGLWQAVDSAIVANGGLIDKHIGDAVMALFGAPVAREDAPELAIRAALDMQVALQEYLESSQLLSAGPEGGLKMRIGINTGLVLLGEIGTTGEYTAMGDTVNVANRLETAAPLNKVLISHDTYRHVRGLFEVLPLDPISVKGKSEPLQVYLVEGIRPRSFRNPTRGVIGVETKTIGREKELQVLRKAFDEVRTEETQRARFVSLIAHAGQGKSRLMYEFINWLDLQPELLYLVRGRSGEHRAHLPFSLVRDMFSGQFGIQENDSSEVAKQKLEKGVAEIVGPDYDELAPFLGHLIGIDYSTHPHLRGILEDARQIRDRAFNAITQLSKTVTQDRTLVFLLDDIHWADDGSLALIEHLAETCADLPLFAICLTRPILFEKRPEWGDTPPIFSRLEVPLLTDEYSYHLVAEILKKVEDVPQELSDMIVSKAEGNPFYMEEMIKILIENGVIHVGEEGWHVHMDKLEDVEVPPTLTGILQARLDKLEEEERETLQRASVVGRIFWKSLVNDLIEDQERDAEPEEHTYSDLQGKDLIFQQSVSVFDDTDQFIFKNLIMRDVTYESVLKKLRRNYHRTVATWLSDHGGERLGEFAGRIGMHYERAESLGQAAVWYLQAGNLAKTAYAPEMAIDYYERALELFSKDKAGEQSLTDQQHIELLENLSEALRWQRRYTEALEYILQMQALAVSAGDKEAEIRSWNAATTIQMYQGDLEEGNKSAQKAEEISRQENLEFYLGKSLFLQGWGYLRMGEIEKALEFAEETSKLSTEIQDQRLQADSFNLLGILNSTIGNFKDGSYYFTQALEIAEEMGDLENAMSLLNNLGVIAEMHSDYQQAFERYQVALEMARRLGQQDRELVFLSNLGGAQVGLGEHQEALENLREILSQAEKFSSVGDLPATYAYYAQACLASKDCTDALEAALKSLELARQINAMDEIGKAWRVLGQVADLANERVSVPAPETGEVKEFSAQDCFAESEKIYSEIGNQSERARTLKVWGEYEITSGDQEKGRQMWAEARDIFDELGVVLEVEKMGVEPTPGAD